MRVACGRVAQAREGLEEAEEFMFVGVELEGEGEAGLVGEAADELVFRFDAVLFGPDLVIGLRGELIEVEVTAGVGEIALDDETGGVFEVDDGVVDGGLAGVDDGAVRDDVDGGLEVLGVRLGQRGGGRHGREQGEKEGVPKDAL